MSALSEFADGLRRCQLLLGMEANFPDPPLTVFDQHSVEALRASISVLMVASFEDFIRAAFRDALASLSRAVTGFTLSDYHQHLREQSIYSGIALASKGPPGFRGRNPQHEASILRVCNAIIQNDVMVDALSSVDSNPSGNQIVVMLQRIGIKDVGRTLDRRYQARYGPTSQNFVSDRLNSIIDVRHVVAHSGRALSVSRLDVGTNLTLLGRVGPVIDAILSDFVVAARREAVAIVKSKKLAI